MVVGLVVTALAASPSSRRAWIEIVCGQVLDNYNCVALLAEGVDRNAQNMRAVTACRWSPSSRRAWIEITFARCRCPLGGSPSSRRAWIEICTDAQTAVQRPVALLAEGVDRNITLYSASVMAPMSPSSRRAWIEIRNTRDPWRVDAGRPPRGGRG